MACIVSILQAGERNSEDYSVPAESVDSAGTLVDSSSYSHFGSLGGITGIATVDTPRHVTKSGYIGQLYEVVTLEISGPASVNETADAQLSVVKVLDDDSTLAFEASAATWSVSQGPLTSVNSSGLATADVVYVDTLATAQAVYEGLINTINLTVLNTITDNYRTYAGDGLGDDWQVQYFGEDNPLADPTFDPDADGQDNTFEYIAGLIPTDASSRFTTIISPVSGQSTYMDIVFSPIVAGRSYQVKTKTDLTAATWDPLTISSSATDGDERIVTDQAATGTSKFYTVEITGP
jgi:hypothetical protein